MHGAGRPGGVGEGDALGDDARGARRLGGAHQDARALAAQSVVHGEVPLDPAWIDAGRQRGQLMDDGIGTGLAHRRADRRRVQRVGEHGLGSRRAQLLQLPGDLVMPVTWWPSASSIGTSLRPITPVAPARKTLMRGRCRAQPTASRSRAHTRPSLKPAAPMANAALKRERRFSSATRSTSSTSWASSKRACSAANSSSLTLTGVDGHPHGEVQHEALALVEVVARRGSDTGRAAARRRRPRCAPRASRCRDRTRIPASPPT